jgi:hypothetical protein
MNTQEGDSQMMFRKWMIGACVAVAAMVGSAVATAQTAEKVGHKTVYVKVDNRSGRPVIGTVIVPEDEDAAKTSGAEPGENAVKGVEATVGGQVAVAPHSEAWLVHDEVAPTPKQGSRAHRLRIMDAKTKRVLYDEVISMSKLGTLTPKGKVTPPTRYAGAEPFFPGGVPTGQRLSYLRATIYPKSLRYKVKVQLETYVAE